MRRKFDLCIEISLALHSLGRPLVKVKGKSVAQLQAILADLRKEQRARGNILKVEVMRVG